MRSPAHLYLHDLLLPTIFTEGARPQRWTCGRWAMDQGGLDALATGFSLNLATRTPSRPSEILDHNIDDGWNWVAEVNSWIGILPAHTDGERPRATTEGGRVTLALHQYVSHRTSRDHASDGRAVVSFDHDP